MVDVDRLDRNLRRWQEECDRLGLANRPHIKTHKSVEIARRQLELGAVGLTCQKLGEAETMVAAGFDDVLIAFNLIGERKLERLAELMRRATVRVTVDDPALLPGLAGAARAAGEELGVLVDCDTGLGRTGVTEPARAAELAGGSGADGRAPLRRLPDVPGVPRVAGVPRGSGRAHRRRGRDGLGRGHTDDVAGGGAATARDRVSRGRLRLQAT